MSDIDKKATGDAAEAALSVCENVLDAVCSANGLIGERAEQTQFVIAIHLLATVAQRLRLPVDFVLEQVTKRLPGAMAAAEGDEHEAIHHGSVPS